jgi:hypothetical protein
LLISCLMQRVKMFRVSQWIFVDWQPMCLFKSRSSKLCFIWYSYFPLSKMSRILFSEDILSRRNRIWYK